MSDEIRTIEDLQKKITSVYPSVEELHQLIICWLEQAEHQGKIEKLVKIALALSAPGKMYPHSNREPFRTYTAGAYVLHYKEMSSLYRGNLVISGRFYHLIVTIGGDEGYELIRGRQLVNYTGAFEAENERLFESWRNTPQNGLPGANFYLPGDWEMAFFGGVYSLALKWLWEAQAHSSRDRRDVLLETLGVVHVE